MVHQFQNHRCGTHNYTSFFNLLTLAVMELIGSRFRLVTNLARHIPAGNETSVLRGNELYAWMLRKEVATCMQEAGPRFGGGRESVLLFGAEMFCWLQLRRGEALHFAIRIYSSGRRCMRYWMAASRYALKLFCVEYDGDGWIRSHVPLV